MTGTITKLFLDRDYGFISVRGQKQMVFFHRTRIEKLDWDQQLLQMVVEFDVYHSPRGPAAELVRPAR